jgi:hypothetical protein
VEPDPGASLPPRGLLKLKWFSSINGLSSLKELGQNDGRSQSLLKEEAVKIRLILAAGLSTIILLGASCSTTRRTGRVRTRTPQATVSVVFTTQERALITRWFRDHRRGLPPGLAKRDRLPPGLEKQVRQRGTLPPGLQNRIHPLPPDLERQLRRLPGGYVRVVVGASVVLMNQQTNVVYDVVRSVVP